MSDIVEKIAMQMDEAACAASIAARGLNGLAPPPEDSWYAQAARLLREQAYEILRLRAEVAEARRVPAGWKLVPVEATREMQQAVAELTVTREWDDIHQAEVYRAMLAAAPQPPSGEGKE